MSMESDDVEACSSTSEISEDFSVPGTSQSWRSQSLSLPQFPPDLVDELQPVENHGWIIPSKHTERLRRLGTPAQKIRKRRNPVRIVPKPQHPSPSTSTSGQQSVDNDPTFPKRKLTTIPEGVVFDSRNIRLSKREMRRINNEPFPNRPQTSKSKAYNEKVAAFKAMLSRITEMANKKSEMLQDTLPDETIKLFKSIHIK